MFHVKKLEDDGIIWWALFTLGNIAQPIALFDDYQFQQLINQREQQLEED